MSPYGHSFDHISLQFSILQQKIPLFRDLQVSVNQVSMNAFWTTYECCLNSEDNIYWRNAVNTGLKDRVILVTASGGIGASTVRMLVKEEAKVIASGRDEDKLANLAMDTGCDVLPLI